MRMLLIQLKNRHFSLLTEVKRCLHFGLSKLSYFGLSE